MRDRELPLVLITQTRPPFASASTWSRVSHFVAAGGWITIAELSFNVVTFSGRTLTKEEFEIHGTCTS